MPNSIHSSGQGSRLVPRRKSSASNLLTQAFKTPPPPVKSNNSSQSSSHSSSLPSHNSTQTSSNRRPDLVDNSDTYSIFSESAPSSSTTGAGTINSTSVFLNGPFSSLSNAPTGTNGQSSVKLALEEMIKKRLGTWDLLKSGHQGRMYWCDTMYVNIRDLETSIDPQAFKTRPYSFFLLGMSLSPLLDIPSLMDYTKALLKVLDEYEAFTEGKGGVGAAASEAAGIGTGVKMRSMFKTTSRTGKRPSVGSGTSGAGTGDVGGPGAGPGVDTIGESLLITSSFPFVPDYFQVLQTFFDTLIGVYRKLFILLFPNQSSPSWTSITPDLPLPLAESIDQYLANRDSERGTAPSEPPLSNTEFNLANAWGNIGAGWGASSLGSNGSGGVTGANAGLASGGNMSATEAVPSGLTIDAVQKIDSKFKRLF
ncbi:hypothetical protein [Phaffia rhodozyma]|uniref:Uncharacterized protein n=1 Tax=Phaffia rhodozyma TaxID=264483 RepID=A0A0F7SFZ6_PHARH|nr:hypothetical protein [Phaffia rhodozyma]